MQRLFRSFESKPMLTGTRRELIDLIETVVIAHFLSLSLKEIEAMLKVKDLRETRVYQEALEEGEAKGLEKGLAKGREEIALRLLAENLPVAKIAELTSLTVQRIRRLKTRSGIATRKNND